MQSSRSLLYWLLYNVGSSARSAIVQTFLLSSYLINTVAETPKQGSLYWGWTYTVSTFVVALGAPLLGTLADRTGTRRFWLRLMTLLCILFTALLLLAKPSPSSLPLLLLLLGGGIMTSEWSLVFYNAYLPMLAPKKAFGRWSGWGYGAGYVGGLTFLGLTLLLMHWLAIPTLFLLTAIWFLLFATPLLVTAPPTNPYKHTKLSFEPNLLYFLAANLFYQNGIVLLTGFAGVIASTLFGMKTDQILFFALVMNVAAGIGAFFSAPLDDRLGSKRLLFFALAALMLFSTLILWTRSILFFWILAFVLSLFIGPLQASNRSLMARLTPQENASEYFGLLSLASQVTSFLGPLIVTLLYSWTGDLRLALLPLLGFFFLGGLLLTKVKREL